MADLGLVDFLRRDPSGSLDPQGSDAGERVGLVRPYLAGPLPKAVSTAQRKRREGRGAPMQDVGG